MTDVREPTASEAPEPPADSPPPREPARQFRRALVLVAAALVYDAFFHGPLAILRFPKVLWYGGAAALPPGLVLAIVAAVLCKILQFQQIWHARVVRAILWAGWAQLALLAGAALVQTQPTAATVWLVVVVVAAGPELARLLWADFESFDVARYRKLKRQGKKWPG